jgi:hypothetical protein
MSARRCSAAVATVIVAALLLSSCGGEIGGGSSTTKTYRNDRYGFSITLDDRFVERQKADVAAQGVFGVAFADENGPSANGRYTDAVLVAVIDMGSDLSSEASAEMQTLLTEQSDRALASLGTSVKTWPSTGVTFNGVSGTVVPFTADSAGVTIVGWDYLFVQGRYLYVVIATSSEETLDRNRDALRSMAESFAVAGTPQPSP